MQHNLTWKCQLFGQDIMTKKFEDTKSQAFFYIIANVFGCFLCFRLCVQKKDTTLCSFAISAGGTPAGSAQRR